MRLNSRSYPPSSPSSPSGAKRSRGACFITKSMTKVLGFRASIGTTGAAKPAAGSISSLKPHEARFFQAHASEAGPARSGVRPPRPRRCAGCRSGQVLRQALMHDTPGRHQVAAVGVRKRLLNELLHQKDATPSACKRAGDVKDTIDDERGEAARRFVQDQQPWLGDDALSNCQDLPLTSRQPRCQLLPTLRQFGKQRIHRLQLGPVAARGPGIGADQQIVLHRQRVKDTMTLQNLTSPARTMSRGIAR